MFHPMSLDLNTILKDWPYESGTIKVRKITGLDGREKLQLRVDLGVLQMEITGRRYIASPMPRSTGLLYSNFSEASCGF